MRGKYLTLTWRRADIESFSLADVWNWVEGTDHMRRKVQLTVLVLYTAIHKIFRLKILNDHIRNLSAQLDKIIFHVRHLKSLMLIFWKIYLKCSLITTQLYLEDIIALLLDCKSCVTYRYTSSIYFNTDFFTINNQIRLYPLVLTSVL